MPPQRPRRTPEEQAVADQTERRQFWIIAAVFAVAIIGLTGLYVALAGSNAPPTPSEGAAQSALPIPDGGAEPTSPGDRGGTQQLLLLGGLIVVFGGGAAWLVHTSRRKRRRLAAEDAQHQRDAAPVPADDADLRAGETSRLSP